MPKKVVQIPIEAFFDESQKSEVLMRLGEADVAEIIGNDYVVVNMSEVLFVETHVGAVIFHFKNRDTLSVTKSIKTNAGVK